MNRFNNDERARKALRINTQIGPELSAELLKEVQTPSPSDFK
ncbi:hypothetical protein SAMN03159339_5257 [Variovorax sp. 770b2]|nr:hypothetical protein SAMN03159339_5257 [Variovorax sp. 770b2]